MRSSEVIGHPLSSGALALLPMVLALGGGAIDERSHLGYSTWLSACRAAGLSLNSVVTFTVELLPTAVLGMLAGGVLLLLTAVWQRRAGCPARAILAPHAGCAVGMLAGLLLCTFALPLPLMLAAEATLAAGASVWLFSRGRSTAMAASVKPRTGALTSAQ